MNLNLMQNDSDSLGDPIGDGLEQDSAFATFETSGGKATNHLHGFGVLALVILVGGGVLGGMRYLGMGALIEMPDITIDYPLEGGQATITTADAKSIIADLNTSGDIDQIPLDEITQNPFEWKGITASGDNAQTVADPAALAALRAKQAAEARMNEIQDTLTALTLNSVMGSGELGVARISGELVRVGDTISDLFRVDSIGGRMVKLSVDGEQYSLALGE